MGKGINTNTITVKFISSKGEKDRKNRAGVDKSDRRIYSFMPPKHTNEDKSWTNLSDNLTEKK